MAIDVNKFLKTTSASRVNLSKFGVKEKTPEQLRQEQINQIMAETKRQTELALNESGSYSSTKLQLLNDIKNMVQPLIKPFTAEGRAEADKRGVFSQYELDNKAKILSSLLGKEVKPDNAIQELKTITPQNKELFSTLSQEKVAERAASIATAPIRFTAGSLATGVTSWALEKANYNGKFTPKTDTEKMIIGENDVQRLTKQDDLYGTVARGASVPAALITMAVLENPFIQGTGISKVIRKELEQIVFNKTISKLGSNEFLRMVDDAIEAGVKEERISKEAAEKLSKEVTNLRLTQPESPNLLEAPKPHSADETISGQGFTMKTVTSPDDVKLAKLNASYDKALNRYNQFPTKENLDSVLKKRETLNKKKETIENLSKVTAPELKSVSDIKVDTKMPVANSSDVIQEAITQETKVYPPKTEGFNAEDGITSNSLVPKQSQRITVEAIRDSLAKDIEGLPNIPTMRFDEQAVLVKQIIDEDPEKPIRIALGKELPTNGAEPESVFRVVKEQAQKNKDIDLLKQLATTPTSVGVQSKKLGQRIKMLDSGVGDGDALTNIQKVIKSRKAIVKKKLGSVTKAKSAEVKKIKEIIKKEIPTKNEWKDFIDSITC